MASNQKLSSDAIRVLRQIHERGLTVLWSFGHPHPTYDDGEEMSHDDWWNIANKELWSRKDELVHIPIVRTETIHRQSIRKGVIVTETILRSGDGSELVTDWSYGDATEAPDQIISESREIEQDYASGWQTTWLSDWIERERIEQDEYIEEFVGLLDRYILTDKAKALLMGQTA